MKATSTVNGKEISIYWEVEEEGEKHDYGCDVFLWGIDDEGIEYEATGYKLDDELEVYDDTIEIKQI